jgi:transcriptional regulator with XRE-family HTH domain
MSCLRKGKAVTENPHTIELGVPRKLRDREYRRKFFLAEASARIAAQLISLRKRRQLNQRQVADLAGTAQPAISRAERADYQSWSFKTLRSIADALDARIRVIIEPAEDVLHEYDHTLVVSDEEVERIEPVGAAAKAAALAAVQQRELQETFTNQRGKQSPGFEIGVSQ